MKMNKLKQILDCFPDDFDADDIDEIRDVNTEIRNKVHALSLDE